jgi:AcrR family transcriptional regulator
LRIIDEEGIEALSMRRLAAEFDVNAASFYYHFANKEEIIAGAAEAALGDIRIPRYKEEDWRDWLVRNAQMYRRALLRHPDLIMVFVKRGRLGIGLQRSEESTRRLEAEGVPTRAIVPLVETLELFAIGTAIFQSYDSQYNEGPLQVSKEEFPSLHEALKNRALSVEREFEVACHAIVKGMLAELGVDVPRAKKPRKSAKTSGSAGARAKVSKTAKSNASTGTRTKAPARSR